VAVREQMCESGWREWQRALGLRAPGVASPHRPPPGRQRGLLGL